MSLFKHSPLTKLMVTRQRSLTLGEKQMAREVFGSNLKLDDIQIIAHRLVIKNYAISPNGNIYFHVKDWCEDFSTQPLNIQSWLIHELTHVWQIQQGIAVIRKAMLDRRYSYVLEKGKAFLMYGVEQQAQMVQDYFVQSRLGKDCQSFKACIPFLKS